MDQAQLADAIGSHLGLLESLFNWAILAGVAVVWAGLQQDRTIEIFGRKLDRRSAFLAAAGAYFCVTLAAAVLFLRIGDLLQLLDKNHVAEGLTALYTHHWLLNPFADFGHGWIARYHASFAGGALIVTWWILNSALYTLTDEKKSRVTLFVLGAFVAAGMTALLSIGRVQLIATELATDAHIRTAAELRRVAEARDTVNSIGIGLGLVIFVVVNTIHKIVHRGWKPGDPD